MEPVNLYTTPTCSQCAKAKAWFSAQDISFTDHNVVADAEALKRMIEVSGSRNVPVIQIGDRVFVGFDENEVAAFLAEQ